MATQLFQSFPWLIALLVMGVALVYFIKRNVVLQREMASQASSVEHAAQEQVAARGRLLAREAEFDRQRCDWEKQMAVLAEEKRQERQRYETLNHQWTELHATLASHQTKVLRLDELSGERDTARVELNRLRQEKNALDAQFAALQSQMEEERRSVEERTRLYTRAETSARESAQSKIDELTTERETARNQLDTLRQEKGALDTEFAALQSKLDEERKSAQEKIVLLEQAERRLAKEFENLANRIFEEKHQKFSQVSKTSVEALLTPMREQLTDFKKKVEDVYDKENKDRASLRTEIQSLKSLNERIGADALNLTKALKGNSKARGTWGEIQLERLLEDSGLVKGREYDVQASHRNEDGQRFQPDVVVHLPEKKDVVIDSKVSLVAYEQYHASESDEERQRQLRAHIASLRTHFSGLSAKNYDELIGINSLDMVIMFVPIEPALLLALEHEPNLFSEAFSLHILLVSPSTLMTTLQIIHNIWRYEHQNRHAQTIAAEAGKLHDQFVNFVDALEKVGDHLEKATESYCTAHKRLAKGKGNLVTRTKNLQILGAKTKKFINPDLLEEAAESENFAALLPEETTTDEEMTAQ